MSVRTRVSRPLAVLVAILLSAAFWSCETVNELAGVGTKFAVASGAISGSQAAGIERTTKAVTKTFEDITPEQEYYIGRTVAATVLKGYRPKDTPALNAYVNELGQALALFSDRPETFGGYRFLVLDSPEINAFAAPGGLILVTRGLLRCCTTEDELAAVLAHEIGHVEKRHGLRAIKAGRLNSALTVLAVEAGKNLGSERLAELTEAFDDSIGDITATLVNSGYSRALEFEADATAVAILRKAGYAPGALVAMLETMAKQSDPKRHDFAATHPSPKDRIARLASLKVTATRETSPARRSRFSAAAKAF